MSPQQPDAGVRRPRLRFHRLAEQVADDLRRRILHGDLEDGALLPKEQELRSEYPVSKPSLREAMRILEAEGLLTVRRGNVGGAVVHRPSSANVAYTMGLVLASQDAGVNDVALALREVEPSCVALCAKRGDRARKVLPTLRKLQKRSLAHVDDLVEATSCSRRFHEALVELCGNDTLILMAGALEALWSCYEEDWARHAAPRATVPVDERVARFDDHQLLIDAIADGDAVRARELAANHLMTAQRYPTTGGGGSPVDPLLIRDNLHILR